MAVEFTPSTERARLAPISWPAIFASLAVGISVMLLLTLAGVAVGVSVVEPVAEMPSPRSITIGAAAWQTISMLIAAVVGGYVAARLSGLRRTADGVLHGAVSWGATTLLYAALATTALGTLTAGMFGLLAPAPEPAAAVAQVPTDREGAQRTLENIGLTAEQARSVLDQMSGSGPAGAPADASRQQVEDTADTVGTATGWLSATVLLALVLSLAGGALGTRGARRSNRRGEHRESAATAGSEASPQVLKRQTT